MKICNHCSKDKFLKKIIKTEGSPGKCTLCEEKRKSVISVEEEIFTKAIACLARYYYSEYEYHTKLGGRNLEVLLTEENQIFRFPASKDKLEREEFVLNALDGIYEDDDVQVITAYGREIYQYYPLDAVRLGDDSLIKSIKRELETRNYFLVEPQYQKVFNNFEKYISKRISAGKIFYRARIGAKESAVDYVPENNSRIKYFTPHQGKEIGAPPIHFASSGRVNRPGVSYLYLASNTETAISEIRPHPGDKVSTGQFVLKNKIIVADLSSHEILKNHMTNEGLDELAYIVSIENTMANASPPSNKSFYGITQFITEMFRKMNFDGVMFKSSVCKGKNLVIFDPSNLEWQQNSGEVHEVKGLKYSLSNCKLYDESKKDKYNRIL